MHDTIVTDNIDYSNVMIMTMMSKRIEREEKTCKSYPNNAKNAEREKKKERKKAEEEEIQEEEEDFYNITSRRSSKCATIAIHRTTTI